MSEINATEAAGNDEEREEVLKLVDQWAKAIVSNDAAWIGSFMADDWVIVSERGVAGKDHFLSFVESGDLTHEAMDIIGDARLQIYGYTAILTARTTNTAHFKGQRIDADEWTTDVFIRREGRWQCVLSHITPADKGWVPG